MKCYEESFSNRPPVTQFDRQKMAFVAQGDEVQPLEFYRALNEIEAETAEKMDSVDVSPDVPTTSSDYKMDIDAPISHQPNFIDPQKAKNFTEVLFLKTS